MYVKTQFGCFIASFPIFVLVKLAKTIDL